jgi:hypothetical protein
MPLPRSTQDLIVPALVQALCRWRPTALTPMIAILRTRVRGHPTEGLLGRARDALYTPWNAPG